MPYQELVIVPVSDLAHFSVHTPPCVVLARTHEIIHVPFPLITCTGLTPMAVHLGQTKDVYPALTVI